MSQVIIRCHYFMDSFIAECKGGKFFFDADIVHRYRFIEPLVFVNDKQRAMEIRLKMWNDPGKPVMLRDKRIKRRIGAESLGNIYTNQKEGRS
ncbi:hypothetical protein LCGC14_1099400 [marine sediment metagenome]|uniref:Uncharacterized protein n=1 Tax=marine sediment metagenome TaxID=412755 RepID=A0A0F9MEH1_9ZZZZ